MTFVANVSRFNSNEASKTAFVSEVSPEVERLSQENSALRFEDGRDRSRPQGKGCRGYTL